MRDPFSEQRAKDALAFEPLPKADWLFITDNSIVARVKYSEALSRKLRAITGAKWDAEKKIWRFPFSSAGIICEQFFALDTLARSAKEAADAETAARQAEYGKRQAERIRQKQAEADRRMACRPTAMRAEFLKPTSSLKAVVTLEAVGDHNARQPLLGAPPRQWVAQIVGISANGRWARAYLQGARDYSRSNSAGSRGVMVTYILDDGLIYQVAKPKSWKSTERWFCKVEGGKIIKISEDEVRACLER